MRPPDICKSYYWNRRTNLTAWDPPAGVEVVWVGELPESGGVHASTYELPSLAPG